MGVPNLENKRLQAILNSQTMFIPVDLPTVWVTIIIFCMLSTAIYTLLDILEYVPLVLLVMHLE